MDAESKKPKKFKIVPPTLKSSLINKEINKQREAYTV